LDAERENLRAALGWTLGAGPTALGVRLAISLWRYWDSRGDLAEGQRWLDRALAAGASVERVTHARLLNVAGLVARRRGEMEQAATWLQESLALSRAEGHMPLVGAVLVNLGNVAFDLADYQRAAGLYADSLQIYRDMGDRDGTAMALNNVGIARRELGHPA